LSWRTLRRRSEKPKRIRRFRRFRRLKKSLSLHEGRHEHRESNSGCAIERRLGMQAAPAKHGEVGCFCLCRRSDLRLASVALVVWWSLDMVPHTDHAWRLVGSGWNLDPLAEAGTSCGPRLPLHGRPADCESSSDWPLLQEDVGYPRPRCSGRRLHRRIISLGTF
jgi:hypothetical protein